MAYDALTTAECAANTPLTTTTMQKVKGNFEYLYGNQAAPSDIPNGSFQIDSDADSLPDGWDCNAYSGGAVALDTTSPVDGDRSLKFTHPSGASNGGGYADSDYVPASEYAPVMLSWIAYASQTGVKCQVVCRWFDKDVVTIGADTTVWSTTAPPTSPEMMVSVALPPAGAKWLSVRVVGGYTDTDPGSSTSIWFDAVTIKPAFTGGRTPSASPAIAEQISVFSSWTDCGSFTVTTPYKSCNVRLLLTAQTKSDGAVTNSGQRFRSGSNYSAEVRDITYTSYREHRFELTCAADAAGSITVYQQLLSDGSYSMYGKVVNTDNSGRCVDLAADQGDF